MDLVFTLDLKLNHMKTIYTLLLSFFLVLIGQAQTAGDYRSAMGSGYGTSWQSNSSWETYNGTTWVAATSTPDFTDGKITIRDTIQNFAVLTLDDGTVLNDSQAVCEYLDRVYGERSVMGNDVVQRAQVCSMRRVAEFEVMYNLMLAFQHSHPSKAQRVEQVPEFVAPSIARAVKAMAYFETILEGRE